MKTSRVQLYGITGKYVVVDTDATDGATVGLNLFWPDGSKVTEAQLRAAIAGNESRGSSSDVTDDIEEGQFNLYFTPKRAQDAVGGILLDTDTIDLTYDGTSSVIKADLKPSGVDPDVYGGGVKIVMIAVDAYGRVTAASDLALVPGNGISFDTDPDTGAVTISVNSFVADNRVTEAGDTRVTPSGDIRITR
jgi:hypothetical protein